MAKQTKKEIQDALLSLIPAGTVSVLVMNAKGKQEYKAVADLEEADEIQVKKDGNPIVMKKQPGRKKTPSAAASTPATEEMIRRKVEEIKQDPILLAAKDRPDDPDVLHQVVLGLGTEAASLVFEREEAERNGDKTSEISIRRVNALKAMADTWLKRKDQIINRGVDLESAAFKAVLRLLIETFQGSMEASGIPDEMIETVLAKMAQSMGPEWDTDAKNRMKNVV